MTEEIWKDIEGYEGMYQVSSYGRVRRLDFERPMKTAKGDIVMRKYKAKMLKTHHDPHGYLVLKFFDQKKNIRVHRLVAMAFVPGYREELFVNHKNEIRDDNRPENLEWCTVEYNNAYGNKIPKIKQQMAARCKPVVQLTQDGEFVMLHQSARHAERDTGIRHDHIVDCCKGKPKRKTAGGYRWKYKE